MIEVDFRAPEIKVDGSSTFESTNPFQVDVLLPKWLAAIQPVIKRGFLSKKAEQSGTKALYLCNDSHRGLVVLSPD
jgi:hypothetical protein